MSTSLKIWGIVFLLSSSTLIVGDGEVDLCAKCTKCKYCERRCISNECPGCEENFKITRSCVIAMTIGAGLAVPFATFVLGVVGFTAVGVTAGTLAALWQSTMAGGVAKGSIFAILQSIGAAGFSISGYAFVSGAAGAAMCQFCASLGDKTGMDMKCSSQISCN